MSCWQDEIHFCEMGITTAKRQKFLLELWTIIENLLKLWMLVMKRTYSFMLCNWLGKILVPSSWEWRTPFILPEKAVMRWQASSLIPGKFQAHCKMFLKVLRCVLPFQTSTAYLHEESDMCFFSIAYQPVLRLWLQVKISRPKYTFCNKSLCFTSVTKACVLLLYSPDNSSWTVNFSPQYWEDRAKA